MGMTRELRLSVGVAAVVAGSLVVSGCVGGPTYGTDKTAGEHLMDDLTPRLEEIEKTLAHVKEYL